MGQLRLFSVAQSRGYRPTQSFPTSELPLVVPEGVKIHVDFASIFFVFMLRTAMQPSPNWIAFAAIIAKQLDPSKFILHLDGAASNQKALCHYRRRKRAESSKKKLMEHLSVWTKLTRWIHRKIASWSLSSFKMTDQHRTDMKAALAKHFEIHQCSYEADCCIGSYGINYIQ